MTPEQIEQMKAALGGATVGPWRHEGNSMWGKEFGYTVELFETYGPDENENFPHDIAIAALAPDMAAHIIAQNEQIAALENRVKAADELADKTAELVKQAKRTGSLGAVIGPHWLHHGLAHMNADIAIAAYLATGEQP